MHEYEMQSFSKTQALNPVFPKLIGPKIPTKCMNKCMKINAKGRV